MDKGMGRGTEFDLDDTVPNGAGTGGAAVIFREKLGPRVLPWVWDRPCVQKPSGFIQISFVGNFENSGRLDTYTKACRMITRFNGTETHFTTETDGGTGGVVSTVEQRRAAKRLENWSAYREMVADLAAGAAVDPVELDLVLSMVDRTTDDMQVDLAEYRKRSERYAVARALPDLDKQLTAAEIKLQQAVAERDRVLAPLEAARVAAYEHLNALRLRHEQASHAAALMRHTWADPVLGLRERQLRSELSQIGHTDGPRVAAIRQELEHIDSVKSLP
jgi:hypothetical protein